MNPKTQFKTTRGTTADLVNKNNGNAFNGSGIWAVGTKSLLRQPASKVSNVLARGEDGVPRYWRDKSGVIRKLTAEQTKAFKSNLQAI